MAFPRIIIVSKSSSSLKTIVSEVCTCVKSSLKCVLARTTFLTDFIRAHTPILEIPRKATLHASCTIGLQKRGEGVRFRFSKPVAVAAGLPARVGTPLRISRHRQKPQEREVQPAEEGLEREGHRLELSVAVDELVAHAEVEEVRREDADAPEHEVASAHHGGHGCELQRNLKRNLVTEALVAAALRQHRRRHLAKPPDLRHGRRQEVERHE
mmetsp:Transcript_40561/g.126877  ORF Transcript_40561/g.126877 Transcript_40561/m.126877 type:complete len:212 (+) Transcript_40561:1292-1927(+)